jgi:glycosyltransferase involved in cell wall biosynthesis
LGKEKLFSVIIIAYNRKEFIFRAISSVIEQTIDKNLYEVICVTNYDIGTEYFESPKFIHIKMEGTIGQFIHSGIKQANGKFICLLEDDDEFEPYKLDHIRRVLVSTDFDYYKDSMSIINEDGESINRKIGHLLTEEIDLEVIDQSYYKNNKKLKSTFMMRGVPSTLTFKRVNAMNMLENLSKIESEIGHYLYYRFIDSNLKILMDRAVLTRYRISSISDSSAMSQKDYARVRIRYCERTLKTYELLIPELNQKEIRSIVKYEQSSLITESYLLQDRRPSVTILCKNIKFYLLSKKLTVSSVYVLLDVVSYLIYPKFYSKGRYLIEHRWKD